MANVTNISEADITIALDLDIQGVYILVKRGGRVMEMRLDDAILGFCRANSFSKELGEPLAEHLHTVANRVTYFCANEVDIDGEDV